VVALADEIGVEARDESSLEQIVSKFLVLPSNDWPLADAKPEKMTWP